MQFAERERTANPDIVTKNIIITYITTMQNIAFGLKSKFYKFYLFTFFKKIVREIPVRLTLDIRALLTGNSRTPLEIRALS